MSRSAARSCRTSSAAHATPTSVAIGPKSGLASATTPATTVAPVAAVSAAAAAAAARAAAAAATAATAARAILGDADPERPALEVAAVELGDRLLRSGVALHLHERKAARPAGLAIGDDRNRHDPPARREALGQQRLRRVKR